MLMNSRFIQEQAGFFAERVRKVAGGDARAQIIHAWKLAYANEPSARETDQSLAFITRQAALAQKATPAPADANLVAGSRVCGSTPEGRTFRIEVAAVDPAGITGQVTVWD